MKGVVGPYWESAVFNSLSVLKEIGDVFSNYLSSNVVLSYGGAKLLKTSVILTQLHGLSDPPDQAGVLEPATRAGCL